MQIDISDSEVEALRKIDAPEVQAILVRVDYIASVSRKKAIAELVTAVVNEGACSAEQVSNALDLGADKKLIGGILALAGISVDAPVVEAPAVEVAPVVVADASPVVDATPAPQA